MSVLRLLRRDKGDGAKAAEPAEGPPRPSFGQKLHAWWEGYELPEAGDAPGVNGAGAAAQDARAPGAPPAAEPPPWTPARIKIAELIWGDGFNFPGSIAHTVDMVKPFGLNKEKSLLDLGCGLGGGTRAIAKELGTYVEGKEHSPDLARAGMELSEKAGLAKRAAIAAFDPATATFPPRRYDAAFARMILWNLADKKRLLTEIDKGLKAAGQITFIDYALKPGGAAAPEIAAWVAAEGSLHAPCTRDEFQAILGGLKFDIRIAEDMTQEFRRLVTQGWGKLVELLGGSAIGPDEAQALVREAELWRTRMALLDSGTLQVARFFAIKRP